MTTSKMISPSYSCRAACRPQPVWLLVAVLVAGCGPSRPDTYPVHGRVTIGGRPVSMGKIMFYPEQGRAAMGNIGADGTYRLTTFDAGDGALPGKHRVTIKALRTSGGVPQADSVEAELAMAESAGGKSSAAVEMQWLVPPKYADRATSPLGAEVRQEDNTIDLELPQRQPVRRGSSDRQVGR